MDDLASTLYWLRLVQLLLAIPLLALAGQGVVFMIARSVGQSVDSNFFFRVLKTVVMPFTRLARLITPKRISDRQLPLVVLSLLLVGYIWVMIAIADLCISHGVAVAQCLQER
ncbi:MAG: hypothetical protein HY848_15415 [Betaproteobacteria bacterium]|nr:hypothetical protein [Betaproteobacteria bacterium]